MALKALVGACTWVLMHKGASVCLNDVSSGSS